MRYVMLTWVHPEDAAAWEKWKDADVQADVSRHSEWFGKHRDKIVGGAELDYPRTVKEIRPGRQSGDVVVVDGPYVESKEFIGGFIELEAADWDEAVAIASEWPSLKSQPHAMVTVQKVHERA
jgi:hypothetical protein